MLVGVHQPDVGVGGDDRPVVLPGIEKSGSVNSLPPDSGAP